MESVIREGGLRLQTTDASCDVILNCQGHKLMAHKLILSIASPVLRDLLTSRTSEPTVLIFPDFTGNAMSLILDYIYTGSVILYSNTINDFLSIAHLLKLQLDEEYSNKPKFETQEPIDEYKKTETMNLLDTSKQEVEIYSRKNQRKLPNLVPIQNNLERRRTQKSLCDHVSPNPWKPRISTVLEDPKKDYPVYSVSQHPAHENDNNNNFHFPPDASKLPNFIPASIQEKIFPLDCHNMYNRFACREDGLPLIRMSNYPKEHEKRDEEAVTFNEDRYSSDSNKSFTSRKNKPFYCEDCGKSFSQLRNYKYHRSVHEGTKEFAAKCQECGKIFNDRGYLSSHMKIHRDKKEYACSHCPKRFNQRVAYNMHLRIHTGIKPHECQTCGKSFSRKMLLKQHQRVHTGERPYSCPECGKTFADRSNMSLHARLHTGVKPYACSLCPKSFTKKHHLKTHMNFHTGLKPYSCQKCGLSFSQSSNMRTHYKKCILKGTPPSLHADNTESIQDNSFPRAEKS
ncbi:hypothetical protein HHI36_006395 [Cryptolaemus montrouzieri]|uniref:Uncharacterized protein n=1 Tax=Cryptolaemus montrouzieri TaxID=559131 RepID=A0ABD2NXD2_9CUCU